MTNWMWDAKRKTASVDSKKTERIDLPEKGFLSSILIKMNAVNGGTSNVANHLHDCVTKIEAVGAGGETMKSYTGVEAQALSWFDGLHRPWSQKVESADSYNQEHFILNFGRYFGDTEYMLDCSKIVDGQLKITWDLATNTAVGATGYLGSDQDIDVNYLIPLDWAGGAPKGYVKTTETKAFTSAVSGIDYTTIPRDNPIRRIMIRAYESGISPAATLTNAKLIAGNNKYIPWDNSMKVLKDLNTVYYPPVWNYFDDIFAKDATTTETNVAYSTDPKLVPTDERSAWPKSEAYGKITVGLDDLATPTAIASEEKVRLSAVGWGYHNCFMLPFDKPDWKPELLLQAQTYSDLKLELTQGNAGGAVAVVTEEVVAQ